MRQATNPPTNTRSKTTLTECSERNAKSLSAAIAPSPAQYGRARRMEPSENAAPEGACQGHFAPLLTIPVTLGHFGLRLDRVP